MDVEELIKVMHNRRIELKITYKKLVVMTGISESNLIKFFKGEMNLGLTNFLKVCHALGLEVKLEADKSRNPFTVKRKDMWQKNLGASEDADK